MHNDDSHGIVMAVGERFGLYIYIYIYIYACVCIKSRHSVNKLTSCGSKIYIHYEFTSCNSLSFRGGSALQISSGCE